ncbi:putative S-locus glycoprotein domain-containing protein [Tanacetum coccineum]
MDDGNLVIKDDNSVIWQSFDYPRDTYLPGMKVGKNLITGRETYLRSWKSADDPSPGEYTVSILMAKGKYQQEYISRKSVIQARLGPYNGIQFAGQPNYKPNQFYSYKIDMVVNQKEMYFMFYFYSTAYAFRCVITPGGRHEFWHINIRNKEWIQDLILPLDNCDTYRLCGPYGSCNTVAYPKCGCLEGFEPNNRDQSSPDNYTSGCRRSTALDCGPGEGFLRLSSMKLPDTQNAVFSGNMSVQDCEVACKNNCSCTAYANPNVTPGGVGCLRWFGELIDVRVYPQNGQDLYVRLAASELQAGLIFLALILALYIWSKWKNKSHAERAGRPVLIFDKDNICSREKGDIEVPLFSLSEVSKATNNFSVDNKLGEGGFGPVYKVIDMI